MKPTELAHLIQAQIVRPGDIALDATAGNGHDTLFLAGLVGEGGRVFAFDVQEAARAQTMARLGGAGLAERVTFCLQNHADLAAALPADPPLRAAMFNLGYLPGSDKAVATRPGDTLAAIRAALALLDKQRLRHGRRLSGTRAAPRKPPPSAP
ncbi:MAG: class I SAM-dependent methyltransferase [Verrucomicrobiales bacterium]